jgi:hypothetical protein
MYTTIHSPYIFAIRRWRQHVTETSAKSPTFTCIIKQNLILRETKNAQTEMNRVANRQICTDGYRESQKEDLISLYLFFQTNESSSKRKNMIEEKTDKSQK